MSREIVLLSEFKKKTKITRKKTDSSTTTARSTSQLKLLAKRSLQRIV